MVEQNYNRTESQKTKNEKSFLKGCLSWSFQGVDHKEDRNKLYYKVLL